MVTPRVSHTATLLEDGRVLVAGGMLRAPTYEILDLAEIDDPATGVWTETGRMNVGHSFCEMVLPQNGLVLMPGYSTELGVSELYDPATGAWTVTGSTQRFRFNALAPLQDGRLLIAGGAPQSAGYLHNGRVSHTTTTLLDGSLLLAGGVSAVPGLDHLEPHTELPVRPR